MPKADGSRIRVQVKVDGEPKGQPVFLTPGDRFDLNLELSVTFEAD